MTDEHNEPPRVQHFTLEVDGVAARVYGQPVMTLETREALEALVRVASRQFGIGQDQTVGQFIEPQVTAAYETGQMPKGLPGLPGPPLRALPGKSAER